MAWRFEAGEALPDAFRRVAAEEIVNVRADLTAADGDRDMAIHQARRRFKRLRALLRLARPSLGAQYDVENRRWRDAGRKLAAQRDAAVLEATFDAVIGNCRQPLRSGDLKRLRARLHGSPRSSRRGEGDLSRLVKEVLGGLDEAERDFTGLEWPKGSKQLSDGLRQSQARLRKSWRSARAGSDPHALHEWRKRLKDQMTQMGLFRSVMAGDLKPRRDEEKRLAELLGEERDLLLLHERLAGPVPSGTEASRDALLQEIAVRRQELRSQCLEAGDALSSEKAGAFAKHLVTCWEAASREEARQPRRRKRNKVPEA